MEHAIILAWVAEQCGPIPGQMMLLVEGAQWQQASIAGDLPAGKITMNGMAAVEGEMKL